MDQAIVHTDGENSDNETVPRTEVPLPYYNGGNEQPWETYDLDDDQEEREQMTTVEGHDVQMTAAERLAAEQDGANEPEKPVGGIPPGWMRGCCNPQCGRACVVHGAEYQLCLTCMGCINCPFWFWDGEQLRGPHMLLPRRVQAALGPKPERAVVNYARYGVELRRKAEEREKKDPGGRAERLRVAVWDAKEAPRARAQFSYRAPPPPDFYQPLFQRATHRGYILLDPLQQPPPMRLLGPSQKRRLLLEPPPPPQPPVLVAPPHPPPPQPRMLLDPPPPPPLAKPPLLSASPQPMRKNKGKGRAPESQHVPSNPLVQQMMLAVQKEQGSAQKPVPTEVVEDNDLEVENPQSRFAVFDNTPQRKQQLPASQQRPPQQHPRLLPPPQLPQSQPPPPQLPPIQLPPLQLPLPQQSHTHKQLLQLEPTPQELPPQRPPPQLGPPHNRQKQQQQQQQQHYNQSRLPGLRGDGDEEEGDEEESNDNMDLYEE